MQAIYIAKSQAGQLRRAVEDRRHILINELNMYGYSKTSDGISVSDLTLTELEQIHINVKCQIGR